MEFSDDDDYLNTALAMLETDEGLDAYGSTPVGSLSMFGSSDSGNLSDGDTSPKTLASIMPRTSADNSDQSHLGKRKAPVTVNRSRNRKREELEYLRDTVQTLQARLLSLEQRIPASGGTFPIEQRTVSRPESRCWKDLALRQLEQRQVSEIRNRKLRKTLEDQLQLAESFKKLFKKAISPEQLSLLAPPHGVDVQPKLSPETIFQRLQDDLLSMYSSVDSIFLDPRFLSTSRNSRDVQVRVSGDLGTAVEIVGSTTVPFDLSSTSRAVWLQTLTHTLQDGSFYQQVISDAGHGVRKEFHVEMRLGDHTGSVRGKIAARQFVEQHRVVIVWSAYAEPVEIANTNMEGLVLRHKGWTVIEHDETENNTQIKTFQLAVPEATRDSPDIHHKVGVLTDFVLSAVDLQLDATQQMVENHLLERMGLGLGS